MAIESTDSHQGVRPDVPGDGYPLANAPGRIYSARPPTHIPVEGEHLEALNWRKCIHTVYMACALFGLDVEELPVIIRPAPPPIVIIEKPDKQ